MPVLLICPYQPELVVSHVMLEATTIRPPSHAKYALVELSSTLQAIHVCAHLPIHTLMVANVLTVTLLTIGIQLLKLA
jgi:hypothetical protein